MCWNFFLKLPIQEKPPSVKWRMISRFLPMENLSFRTKMSGKSLETSGRGNKVCLRTLFSYLHFRGRLPRKVDAFLFPFTVNLNFLGSVLKSSLWKFYCNKRRENRAGICTHSFWYQSLLLRTVWGLPPNFPFLTIVDVEMKLVKLNSRDFDISRCLKVENLRNILSYSLFWTCTRLFETLDTEYCPSLARTICCRQGKGSFHTSVKRSC